MTCINAFPQNNHSTLLHSRSNFFFIEVILFLKNHDCRVVKNIVIISKFDVTHLIYTKAPAAISIIAFALSVKILPQ